MLGIIGVGVLREHSCVAVVCLGEQSLRIEFVAVERNGARCFGDGFIYATHKTVEIQFQTHEAVGVCGQIHEIIISHKHTVRHIAAVRRCVVVEFGKRSGFVAQARFLQVRQRLSCFAHLCGSLAHKLIIADKFIPCFLVVHLLGVGEFQL